MHHFSLDCSTLGKAHVQAHHSDPFLCSSSVATHDEIMMPETLLKKRKSREKEREEKLAQREKTKKVCSEYPIPIQNPCVR